MQADDLRGTDCRALSELRAEIPGQVRHALERALTALVHPVHELTSAKRLAAQLSDERFELGTRKSQEVGLGRWVHERSARTVSRADATPWYGRSRRSRLRPFPAHRTRARRS